RADLVEELEERERLCPTTISPGVALPHPAHPLPYNIARSFVIVGLTASGIPFGCPDGSLTRLFFLICCKDERTHLHLLARISRMLLNRVTPAALMGAHDAVSLAAILHEREAAVRGEQ
ncbi:MAG TPA: PTS sugar transporter subunit IIA, partial [Phycisphaerae bacterium]|nr:PTS sugar transporter subunit IIA [Phycisphaerae bacterium]